MKDELNPMLCQAAIASAVQDMYDKLRAEGAATFKANVVAWLRSGGSVGGNMRADDIESGAVERWVAERESRARGGK